MTKLYTIVNDGQMTWVANTSELIAALDAQGWPTRQDVGGYRARVEPETDDAAYTTLCDAVPAQGIEPTDDMAEFTFDPSRSAWVWG